MEIRKDIIWYEWYFQCSDLGRVRTVERISYTKKTNKKWEVYDKKVVYKSIILKQDRLSNWHIRVRLNNYVLYNGRYKQKHTTVSKLVYCTFNWLDIDKFKTHITHINWDIENNRLLNLAIYDKYLDNEVRRMKFLMNEKNIDQSIAFDVVNKLQSNNDLQNQSLSKKIKDTQEFILEFIKFKNEWIDQEEDNIYSTNNVNLSDFWKYLSNKLNANE